MTDENEPNRRRRHILKRSATRESTPQAVEATTATEATTAAESTTAAEPESGAIEETVEAPAVETAEAPVVATTEAPVVATNEEPVVEANDEPVVESDEPVVESNDAEPDRRGRGSFAKVFAFGVVPFLAVVLAVAVGWLTFNDIRASQIDDARDQAVQVAKDSAVALLSYNPDEVEQQLTAARSLLTGQFLDAYTQLTTDVVIPGAKQQRISAVATVPRAAPVSAETDHAVVLVFVNQTVVVADNEPNATLSSVRVTLDKIDGKWLISTFDPV